jgi:carboxyl-terminal processing protease
MKNISIAAAAILFGLSLNPVFADEKPNAADPHQVAITVGRLLEQGHYSRQKLDAEMSRRILDTYLENLDYNKLFFTQEDINQVTQKYGATLGDSILLGDLQPAKEIYNLFRVRVEDRIAKIRQLLKREYSKAVGRLLLTGAKSRGPRMSPKRILCGEIASKGNCFRKS